ncbi:MAG TPA: ATP-binding cassette domain-containing protein, partial [Thermoanaerobaculia bacterium]|nr:ATP-binding cassette domain-containing protein [Thermoanaerobaculia bacterium]
PALLFAAAAMALSSLRAAFVGVSASAAGVAFAAPALLATASPLDAIALLAVGAATACVTGFAVRTHRERVTDSYRVLRHDAAPALLASLAVVIMLVIFATAPAAARDGWRGPLAAAAALLAVGMPASLFVAPALNVVWTNVRRRRTPQARAAAHPVEWRSADPPDLVVRSVAKRYESGLLALREISFTLTPGVIGLLGPNGAGKTTLLRTLTGLLMPTRGQVLHRGIAIGPQNLAEYRRLIGFLPQEFNAYAALSAIDFLEYWALERGITNAAERRELALRLLATVGLENDGTRRVRDFSGGMRQRIGIARALIGDPPLLVVDEPTTGLDLESRHRFHDLIVSLAKDRIIILSTHIASDVEATASRILLLARGRLQWDGTPAALIARARGRVFDAVVSDEEARALSRRFRLTTRLRTLDGVRVRGVVPRDAELPGPATTPTLEEAYIAEVGLAAGLSLGE